MVSFGHRPTGLLLALAAIVAFALAIVGCSSSGGGDGSTQAEEASTGGGKTEANPARSEAATELVTAGGAKAKEKAAPTPDAPDQTIDGAKTVDVYFTGGEQFQPLRIEVPEDANPLLFAAEKVIEGPTAREGQSAPGIQTLVPEGTKVENLKLTSGRVTVELTPSFLEGIPADAKSRTGAEQKSLEGRLAQITYTVTAFKEVDAVRIVSDGISLSADRGRADFQEPKGPPPVITHSAPVKVHESAGKGQLGAENAQQALADLHYLPESAVDGNDGYRTQQAVMAFQAWEGLQRDGAIGPETSAALRDATEPKPARSGPERRIEIYRDKGVALIVRDGKLERAIHVSAGRPGYDTPTGSYSVFRKELQSYSIPFSVYLPYASYFTGGIALHEYADVPAYPASHGCVRVSAPEAKFVYAFASLGTSVVVY